MSSTFAKYPSLVDKPCLITGGASGIGEGLVKHFHDQGARVAFLDVDSGRSHSLKEELTGRGKHPVFYEVCDLLDIEGSIAAIDRLANEVGLFEVLVNNAGDDRRYAIDEVVVEAWDWQLNINLRPHFFLSRHVAGSVAKDRKGSVVNMGSIAWRKGVPTVAPYAAAKAGIMGLTTCLAREFGPQGVRVNSIAPGWVMTDKQKGYADEKSEAYQATIGRQAIQEPLDVGDIARLALWLTADDSLHCTGQTFNLDGGYM